MAESTEVMYALFFSVILVQLSPFDEQVKLLSHRSHRIRQQAYQSLKKLGPSVVPLAVKKMEGSLDVGTRRFLEGLVQELEAERISRIIRVIRERYGEDLPMIDAFWLDWQTRKYDYSDFASSDFYGAIRQQCRRRLYSYFEAASKLDYSRDRRRWAPYREATYLFFYDLLDAGTPVLVTDGIFLLMRIIDNRWIGGLGDSWWKNIDPLHVPGWQKPPKCVRHGEMPKAYD